MQGFESLSMPYVSDSTYKPTWARTAKTNEEYLKKILPDSKVVARYTFGGLKVPVRICTLDKISKFIFVEKDNIQIIYGVKVVTFIIKGKLDLTTVGQVSVWRRVGAEGTSKIAPWVFENMLYPKYNTILSDSSQSAKGKDFWYTRVSEALEKGIYVYAIEVEQTGNTLECIDLIRLRSTSEMNKYYSRDQDYYKGHFYRFLLSKQDLLK